MQNERLLLSMRFGIKCIFKNYYYRWPQQQRHGQVGQHRAEVEGLDRYVDDDHEHGGGQKGARLPFR